MISIKYIQELLSPTAFKRDYSKTIEDLYTYIVESEINGNRSQVREFINELSNAQFRDLIIWLNSTDQNREYEYLFLKLRGC